jgi:hypothetical protein
MTRVARLLLIGGLDADCTASTRLLRCLLSCHVPHGGKRKGTYPPDRLPTVRRSVRVVNGSQICLRFDLGTMRIQCRAKG